MEKTNVANTNLIYTTQPDYIAGIEARGFVSASMLAFKYKLVLFLLENRINYLEK